MHHCQGGFLPSFYFAHQTTICFIVSNLYNYVPCRIMVLYSDLFNINGAKKTLWVFPDVLHDSIPPLGPNPEVRAQDGTS
jgi:hypothetical protein